MPDISLSDAREERRAFYSISDVEAATGISAFTIRYYDTCGFFPNLHRTARGVRKFADADIQQLHLVESLRKSGLSIEGIQYYVKLAGQGSASARTRLDILRQQALAIELQRDELDLSIARLEREIDELRQRYDDGRA